MQQQRLINNSSQLNMFREIILPIFRSTRLCVTVCGIMHPWCCRPMAGPQLHFRRSQQSRSNCSKFKLVVSLRQGLTCHVKGEAAALSVRAQRCQSHYFSTTPRSSKYKNQVQPELPCPFICDNTRVCPSKSRKHISVKETMNCIM